MKKEIESQPKLEEYRSLVSSFYTKNKLTPVTANDEYWQQFFLSHKIIFIAFPDPSFALKFLVKPSDNKENVSSTAKKAIFVKIEEGIGLQETDLENSAVNTDLWRDNWKNMFLVFKNNRMLEEVEPSRVRLWQLKERLIALRNIKRDMESKEDSIMDHKVVVLDEKKEAHAKDEGADQNQLWQETMPPKEERHFFLKF